MCSYFHRQAISPANGTNSEYLQYQELSVRFPVSLLVFFYGSSQDSLFV